MMNLPDETGGFWERHLGQWKKSGMSQSEYCRIFGLKFHQFHYWKKKLSKTEVKEPQLVAVPLDQTITEIGKARSGVRVIVDECTIEVESHFDTQVFSQVVSILRGR